MRIFWSIVLIGFACLSAYVTSFYRPVWQFDHLEANARKVISAAELQTWATNLLANPPTSQLAAVTLSDLGTNFPKQLRGLAPKLGPHVFLYESQATNLPRSLRIYWGSGFLGAHGFEIGPTNFASARPGHVWAPGVYFYER